MDGLTRRTLLRASGVAGATALLAGAAGVTLEHVLARGQSDPLPANSRILVLVTMNGGNDGLNTVVPYADPAYHDARPGLAYAPESTIFSATTRLRRRCRARNTTPIPPRPSTASTS